MNSNGDDLPAERPTSKRHLADLFSEISVLVDKTVARITDADVEQRLGRVLGFGEVDQPSDRRSRRQKLGGAHQGAAVPAAPASEPLKVRAKNMSWHEHGPGGPTVLRILLGTQLRRLREARGVTAQQAAWAIRGTESKISRLELGQTSVREVDIIDLLSLYGITDPAEREELLTLAGQANQPGWWHQYEDLLPSWFQAYVGLEEWTESIRSYDSRFIPGLLQTDDYATALLALGDFSIDEAERLVLLRKERQMRFASGHLRLWAIVDEVALTRPVGSRQIMRAQLEHLSNMCDQPGIALQVVPDSAGAHLARGSFSILRLAVPDLPDIVYVEQLTSAIYLDKPVDVDRYATAIDKLSATAAPPEDSKETICALLKDLE